MRTYAGAAKHLERAVVVAFYRGVEAIGIERPAARQAVERADVWLQRIGTVYLMAGIVIAALLALGVIR